MLMTVLCTASNSGTNKRQITDLVDQSIQINTHCFVVTADNRYVLVCGFWDKSFRVYSTETGMLQYIYNTLFYSTLTTSSNCLRCVASTRNVLI